MNNLLVWALAEKHFIETEIEAFKAGAKLTSDSGHDISAEKLRELEARLHHGTKVFGR